MSINVLRQCYWCNVHIGGNLTEMSWNGIIAYVRENIRYDSFRMSANHRLGLKRGEMPPDAVQVLELSAPREHWEAIAQQVKTMDNLNREVVRGKFSRKWAEAQFRY
jgi:hypothetical protein